MLGRAYATLSDIKHYGGIVRNSCTGSRSTTDVKQASVFILIKRRAVAGPKLALGFA